MRVAILIAALGGGWPSIARAESDDPQEVTPVVRFALIHPEADPETEDTTLEPGASWLRRPKKTSSKPKEAAGAKKGPSKVTLRIGDKSELPVTPLRRDRPKKEIDPPKTRRRQLGW